MSKAACDVHVRRGRARPLWHGHPWLFSEAIERLSGRPEDGDEVRVLDPEGRFIGRGLFAERSQIRVRLYARTDEPLGAAFFEARLGAAFRLRREVLGLPSEETTGYRLVHGEGDGLPGLVCDVFGDVAVLQLGTPGLRARAGLVVDALRALLSPRAIVLAPSADAPRKEDEAASLLHGELTGPVVIRENGLAFECELLRGQKTGFYFDQRENRARVAAFARGRAVVDAYCYSGGFALACARAGAREVVAIDSSSRAIATLRGNAERNGLAVEPIHEDVSRALRALHESGRRFDLVVLDPPKFAPRAGTRDDALKAYRAVNGLGLSLLDEGLLATASCAHHVGEPELLRVLAEAGKETGRVVRVLETRTQATDHPFLAACPESRYLTLLLCHVSRA